MNSFWMAAYYILPFWESSINVNPSSVAVSPEMLAPKCTEETMKLMTQIK